MKINYQGQLVRLAKYQMRILASLKKAWTGKAFLLGIVGARSSAKSWTIALGMALWMQSSRNFVFSIIPSGSGAQARQITRYFNQFYPVKLRDGRHWAATEMRDKRGN